VASKLANKMIMLEDIVDKPVGKLVNQLVLKKELDTIYNHRPNSCPHCHSKEIVGIEVMGSFEDILLWECGDCEDCFLKFDKIYTEKELQCAKGYWTNNDDWGYCPKSQYN
jgi:hypothetical protein